MWQCTQCKRTFQRKNQSHSCIDKPQTVDAYIQMQDRNKQEGLLQVRKAIRDVLPEAQERIAWGMPTFWNGKKNIIHFAAFKHHIGLYPGAKAIEVFAPDLTSYSVSKGSIRIPYQETIPVLLVQRIALWCAQNMEEK